MAEYMPYTNQEDQIDPWDGILLKKARAKSVGGTLTDRVQPGQSMLPNARAAVGQPVDYRQRSAELFDQGMKKYQEHLDGMEGSGEGAMLNALAAQFAGEKFAPLQQFYLKKAGAADEAQAKKAEFLMQQAKAYETLAQSADTARERIAAQRQAQELQNQLRLMGLQIQQQGLDLRAQTNAAARAQAEQTALDRLDRQLGEGTQKLSKQAQDFTGLYAGVGQLNAALKKYIDEGKEGKIPGIGLGSNIGIGSLNISSPFIGEEGKANRAMAQNVLNQIIRADSGQAVSTQEAARQLLAAMNRSDFTEADFLNAWEKNILPRVNASFANIGAGYSPTVKQRYRDQGGKIDFDKPFENPRPEKGAAKGGSGNLSAQEQAELEALRKRFGGK